MLSLVSAFAFGQNKNQQSVTVSAEQQMAAIKNCSELNNQLVKLFGENFSLTNPDVVKQLQKNANDTDKLKCIVKVSAHVVGLLNANKEKQPTQLTK